MKVYIVVLLTMSKHWFASHQVIGTYHTYKEAHDRAEYQADMLNANDPDNDVTCHTQNLWMGPQHKIEIVSVLV